MNDSSEQNKNNFSDISCFSPFNFFLKKLLILYKISWNERSERAKEIGA